MDPERILKTSNHPFTPRGHNLLREVDELIDPHIGQWDEQLARDLFWEEDAALILALPVHQGRDNSAAWHFDKRGVFSVKSVYKVARDDQLRNRTTNGQQSGSNSAPDGVLKQMWKLQCPNKTKHFLWRFAHNSHPLRCNLVRRGMVISVKCPVCDHQDEDGGHLFFKCKGARDLWNLPGLEAKETNWRLHNLRWMRSN